MNGFLGNFREKICIEGTMPERALLRLRRAGIAVYNVKKTAKNQIQFRVKKKDSEKVFAIYPNVCYNRTEYSPYVARKMGAVGLGKPIETLKKRVGLLLGGCLFFGLVNYADAFVFDVEIVGEQAYKREAVAVLEENGLKPFSTYKKDRVDLVCAQLLALGDVEYCSVRKFGGRIVVEIRTTDFSKPRYIDGDMLASRSGTLLSITALRGTVLKRAGDEIKAGETLVGGWFLSPTDEEKRVRVQPIARARIACTYETDLATESAEQAFAEAYLALGLSDRDEIVKKEITENNGLFHVKIEYTVVQTMNV